MTIRFSPSTCGFYDTGIHGDAIPADALPVAPKRHRELLEGQALGGAIVAGPSGRPIIAKHSATAEDRRAGLGSAIRREAARRIDGVSPIWRQLNDQRDLSPEGLARFAAIDAIRGASNDIEALLAETPAAALADFPVRDNPLWPEVDAD